MDEWYLEKYIMQMKDSICISILAQAIMSSWNGMGAAAYDDEATRKKLSKAMDIAKDVYDKKLRTYQKDSDGNYIDSNGDHKNKPGVSVTFK